MSGIEDLNYFPMELQPSIYITAILTFEDDPNLVLVAAKKGHVYCVTFKGQKSHIKKIQFSYIPSDNRIMAVRALKQGKDEYVIGITHYNDENIYDTDSDAENDDKQPAFNPNSRYKYYGTPPKFYFNLYANCKNGAGRYDIEAAAQSCQTFSLKYCPSCVFPVAACIADDGKILQKEPVWLVAGNGEVIHTFAEDKTTHSFNEVAVDQAGFSDLNQELGGRTMWIDMMYVDNKDDSNRPQFERLTCFGMDDGTAILFVGAWDATSGQFRFVKRYVTPELGFIVTSVRIFKVRSTYSNRLRRMLPEGDKLFDELENKINLLVVSSEGAIFYDDVLRKGFDDLRHIPSSCQMDANICAVMYDINHDGINELLIGNCQQEIMIFNYDAETGIYYYDESEDLKVTPYSIDVVDITKSGVDCIVVLQANGLVVMQPKIEKVLSTVKRRVQLIFDSYKKVEEKALCK